MEEVNVALTLVVLAEQQVKLESAKPTEVEGVALNLGVIKVRSVHLRSAGLMEGVHVVLKMVVVKVPEARATSVATTRLTIPANQITNTLL